MRTGTAVLLLAVVLLVALYGFRALGWLVAAALGLLLLLFALLAAGFLLLRRRMRRRLGGLEAAIRAARNAEAPRRDDAIDAEVVEPARGPDGPREPR